MKILFIAPYVPNSIRVRPYQMIRSLAQRGHELTLLTVSTSQSEQADIEALRAVGIHVLAYRLPRWRSVGNGLRALASRLPLQAAYSVHPGLMQTLEKILREQLPDVIHVEHLRGVQFGLRAKSYRQDNGSGHSATAGKRIPVVWDSVDCISHLFEQASQQSRSLRGRMMTRIDLNRTRRYEGWLVHQFDQVVVTSPADCVAFAQLASRTASIGRKEAVNGLRAELAHKLNVVPNGVDLAYFAPNGAARETAQIVFSGKMSYHANVTAALHLVKDIMPGVWARRPDAQVWIVGKDPAPEVRALASTNGAASRRVFVTGTVPDLSPYLQKATLAVAPISYGAGIQNKVLEAMACGAPVVASRKATAALAVACGRELLIADDTTAFTEAILHLLDNPQRRNELGLSGRTYVEQRHSWDQAVACLEQVYHKALCI
jgi:glycosyltransferase involved in cell wall biosynthesis